MRNYALDNVLCFYSQSDFKSRLEHTMQGIQHESLDVRLHALPKLKKLLQEERVSRIKHLAFLIYKKEQLKT